MDDLTLDEGLGRFFDSDLACFLWGLVDVVVVEDFGVPCINNQYIRLIFNG